MGRLYQALIRLSFLLAITTAHSALAGESFITGACAVLNNQAIIASNSGNWVEGEQIGRKEVALCSSKYPNFVVSDFYSFLAVMQYNQDHFKDSLSTADACIAVYYRSPGCHLLRFRSLAELKNNGVVAELLTTNSVSREILADEGSGGAGALYGLWLVTEKPNAQMALDQIAEFMPSNVRK